VPDEPETSATLPPAPPAPVATDDGLPAAAGPDALYVTLQGGVTMKATSVTPEGNRVRITVPDGSFTVARGDLVGVVRMPSSGDTPEVWLTAVATEEAPDGAMGGARPTEPTAPAPPRRGISVPAPSSDRPHLLRLANGQRFRIDGFWIENGELRFRRFGGLVGVALSEVTRLIPEAAAAPARGLTPVRFVQQVTPDLLEVRVGTGSRRVRLIGVEPAADAPTADNPLARLDRGVVLQLEFDRQRSDARGDWLAYVYLPNGRMLNAELIRLRLARPRADSRNVRHLDLFEEIAGTPPIGD